MMTSKASGPSKSLTPPGAGVAEIVTLAHAQVDLTSCDLEPIHHIGAIQPVGFLVATSSDWLISRVSANSTDFLGGSIQALLGAPLPDVFVNEAVHTIRNRLAMLRGPDAVERIFAIRLQDGGPLFDVAVHISGSTIIVEAEPSQPPGELNAGAMVRSMMSQMRGRTHLAREAVRLVQSLTGFDRVMIYRFHADDSGEVIAERARAGLAPFLGLRYPAEDIPRQARALLIRNPLRLLADVDGPPSLIVPQLDAMREPLDLSMSTLRAHSTMCIEYLKNMGVGATMTVSLVRDGRLWGLISCHHMSARHVGFEQRTTVELFGHLLSFLIAEQERAELASYEARMADLQHQLGAALLSNGAPEHKIADMAEQLRDLVPFDGLAVCVGDQVILRGETPALDELAELRPLLDRTAANQIFSTDNLGSVHAAAKNFAERAAGMLVVPISRSPRDYVIFFRHEFARSVVWAGEPGKLAVYGPNGPRLTPRKSFEAWRELKRGQSAPWSEGELRVSEVLRVSLLEAMLHFTGMTELENRAATQRHELLVAELNHRVRNILGLIRSLISQSRISAADVDTFATILGNRVHALARAHDQITAKNWGPGSLATLIATEAGAFLGEGEARIDASGPSIYLQPQAFSTVALVIHELMANAVKYGALAGGTGRVTVAWRHDADGSVTLDWNEAGGPAVAEPTRQGFGSTIIRRSIPHELGGQATLDYAASGFHARFVLPSQHIVVGETSQPIPIAPSRPGAAVRLSGLVLAVEDNVLIALDVEDVLIALGAARVVVASNVTEALRLIDLETPSFALLDINLGRENSWPIATRLRSLGVHHVFATGYGDGIDYPVEHRLTAVITKPYTSASIAQAFSKG
jgi:light-regulated signal transduction histidine kinase (bacteriophytochrome)/CheY-like chemotaxis protein